MQLADKVAVITGAASGMGRAMAELFTQEGCRVVAGDWHAERLNQTVDELAGSGADIVGLQGNIADQASAEALVELAVTKYGHVDVLANCAGVMDYMAGVGEVTDEAWERVIGINLNGSMYTSRKAVQHMLNQGGGSIINVGSTASVSGGAAGVAYTTSKHALLGLTRSTAWMYAQRGIRCNLIAPGGTKTNIAESMPQEKLDLTGAQRTGTFAQMIPSYLEPLDIARLALFLASDGSKMINGAVITADGGWMAL